MPGLQPLGADSPGRVLRSAREALGLSRREIAEALNLLESTVVAIEDDDTARQPEPVFLRGYVRNYAKLLRLDPEPLVTALNSDGRPAAIPVKVPKPLRSNRWFWPMAGAVLAMLILIATVVYFLAAPSHDATILEDEASLDGVPLDDTVVSGANVAAVDAENGAAKVERWDPSVPPAVGDSELTQATIDGSGVDVALGTVAGPAGESGAPSGEVLNSSESPIDPLSAELTLTSSVDEQAAVEPSEKLDPASVDVIVAADSMTTIQPRRLNRGTDQIRLDFAQDCWVRVKDATGKMLFSDMGRAGGAMELTGTGPFDLLLGNALGTTLKWNGEPIALQPFMRNNVATLKLGENSVAQADEPKSE